VRRSFFNNLEKLNGNHMGEEKDGKTVLKPVHTIWWGEITKKTQATWGRTKLAMPEKKEGVREARDILKYTNSMKEADKQGAAVLWQGRGGRWAGGCWNAWPVKREGELGGLKLDGVVYYPGEPSGGAESRLLWEAGGRGKIQRPERTKSGEYEQEGGEVECCNSPRRFLYANPGRSMGPV